MINKIIQTSLKNRVIVITLTVLLLIAGSIVTTRMEVDIFPDLNAPTVAIMTEAHGMAPEEVEKLVTFPIETAVNGATNIRRVRSSSTTGFSIVWVEFDWDMNIYTARQVVTEKLAEISSALPEHVESPVLAPQSSILGEVMVFAMESSTLTEMELRTFADWNVRTRLLATQGIAQISVLGGDIKQYQILAHPHKMKYYGVTFQALLEACENVNDNATGNIINQYGSEYLIRGIIRTNDVEEIKTAFVAMKGDKPVLLSDIADIKIMSPPPIGKGAFEGEEAVIVTITKQPNVNTIELSEKVKETLSKIKKENPNIIFHTNIFDQAQFIETSIGNIQRALIEGAIFVILILFIFLMNIRTTIISLLAIPLSLIISILTLKLLGLNLNTMSLGGMAIAIGSIVDDAIIDVENVYKRMKQQKASIMKKPAHVLTIVYEASKEIRTSIFNATLIIIVAFVPLFFLSGLEGRMLKPLGIAFIVSLFASLFVAITITPVLCSYLLKSKKQLNKHHDGSWLTRKLLSYYESALRFSLNHKKSFIAGSVSILTISIYVFFTFGSTFLPQFNEGSLTINISTEPGTSLELSDKIGTKAEKMLLSVNEINTTCRKTGRAELAEHSFGSNVSEIEAPYTLSDRSREDFLADVRKKLSNIDGAVISIGQPISHKIDHSLSGSKTNIAVKLFGTNLKEMHEIATKVKNAIQDIPNLVDLSVEQQIDVPEIHIKPKRLMLAKYGITMGAFQKYVEAGIGGKVIGKVLEGDKSFDLTVRIDPSEYPNIESIEDLFIDEHMGNKIYLHNIADIKSDAGPNAISRENVKRKIVISANVSNGDLRNTVLAIKDKIDSNITLPKDYFIEYGGQFESAERASRTLLITSLISILIIVIILFQEFKNIKLAGIILLNLPFALIGGIFAIQLSNQIISIPSIIGFITLFGIATRNGILLISRYQALIDSGKNLIDTLILASKDRLTPILMTALTAALALIPLAINGDKPGNEIQSPMAIVILGGLLSSTILNMFIIPIAYSFIFKDKQ